MRLINNHVAFVLFFLASCIGSKSTHKNQYLGNFKEHNYAFLESISHGAANSNCHKIPFDIKFRGIRPYPYDSIGKQDFTWLRNPDNLLITFNTLKSIGLNKFVSFEQYNTNSNDSCYNTQWANRSLNEVIKGFIESDTVSFNGDYYSKFWARRRKEGNIKVTYQILKEIHQFYNDGQIKTYSYPIDTTLNGLLTYDLQLANTEPSSYRNTILNYFNYLKSAKLEYSAYKLIFHNRHLEIPKKYSDSLLTTLHYDTISYETWSRMNDNTNGWMTSRHYPDPNKNYGP